MPVPKKRMSATRSGNRRSQDAIKNMQSTVCGNCQATILPHMVCAACGFYKGERVLPAKSKKQ
jgi:large subunit ribosomal protein L32